MHIYAYAYIDACMHTYIHAYIHTCIHTCIHTYIHTSTQTPPPPPPPVCLTSGPSVIIKSSRLSKGLPTFWCCNQSQKDFQPYKAHTQGSSLSLGLSSERRTRRREGSSRSHVPCGAVPLDFGDPFKSSKGGSRALYQRHMLRALEPYEGRCGLIYELFYGSSQKMRAKAA